MNDLERSFATHLEIMRHAGKILWWAFESMKFRLADNTFYEPDFAVMRDDCVMEIFEVKGFWEDDARVKIKVAASLYPFSFIGVTRKKKAEGGGFAYERF